jgi:tRNA A37 methylthiotransferase MiaB
MDDQISKTEKERRARLFIELGNELRRGFIEGHIGSVQDVLFEREAEPGVFRGFTPNYIEVSARYDGAPGDVINRVLPVRLGPEYSEIIDDLDIDCG